MQQSNVFFLTAIATLNFPCSLVAFLSQVSNKLRRHCFAASTKPKILSYQRLITKIRLLPPFMRQILPHHQLKIVFEVNLFRSCKLNTGVCVRATNINIGCAKVQMLPCYLAFFVSRESDDDV